MRLARALLLLANYGGDLGTEPVPIKVNQETLAALIGTTRSRVNLFMIAVVAGGGAAYAANELDAGGIGKEIGTLERSDTEAGLRVRRAWPAYRQATTVSMFTLIRIAVPVTRQTANQRPAWGLAAISPANTGKHLGPLGEGHKGGLPALTVDADGKATQDVLAPHLKVSDVKGHSIMIHVGGDNYSDQPAPLGGGGARIACGVAK